MQHLETENFEKLSFLLILNMLFMVWKPKFMQRLVDSIN